MENEILYKSDIYEGQFQVELKSLTFIVEVEREDYDAEYTDGLISQPSGELFKPTDIVQAWKNDADSTPIELNDKLKTELLCLIN
jgi:hypothetical protein